MIPSRLQPLVPLDRQKYHPDAIFAGRRQSKTQVGGFAGEKFVRDLDQEPGAVASIRIAATCAAVSEVDEDLNPLFDDVVGLLAFDVGHKTNSAGIVLLAG